MPEGVGYGPQFTASTGKSLNYIGVHIYGYSGAVATGTGAGDTTLLEFQTGQEYLVTKLNWSSTPNRSDDYILKIKMNGEIIFAQFLDRNYMEFYNLPPYLPVLIPSNTKVEIIVDHNAGSNDSEWHATLTGKIYGKIE